MCGAVLPLATTLASPCPDTGLAAGASRVHIRTHCGNTVSVAELEGLLQPEKRCVCCRMLVSGKKNSTWGNICQFEMLFVQFTLQRSGPNWPFFRGAMMEQSPALRAMTEAGARRRKIEALKTQMEHLKEELQMVVAVEILMRQEYHNLDSALDLIEEFQNTRNGRQQLFIDSERGRDFSG